MSATDAELKDLLRQVLDLLVKNPDLRIVPIDLSRWRPEAGEVCRCCGVRRFQWASEDDLKNNQTHRPPSP